MLRAFHIEPHSAGSHIIGFLVWQRWYTRGVRVEASAAQSRRRSKRSSKALLYKSRQYQLQRCTARLLRFSEELGEKAPSYGTVFNIVRSLGADLDSRP